jgi:hypothetical protein
MIMSNYEEMQSIWADQKQRREQANRANVPTILGALAALGIAQVEGAFDGYADEGQIDRIDATGGSGELTGEITVETALWSGSNQPRQCSLTDAIEELCYTILQVEYPGWEINDGAFGCFVLDVAGREVGLEFNGRYLSYETSLHTYGEV